MLTDEQLREIRARAEQATPPENRHQYREWLDSGQALQDALNRVCELEERLEKLEEE